MKKYIIYFTCLFLFMIIWGCNSQQQPEKHIGNDLVQNKSEDDGHDHSEGEDCDHDHKEDSPSHADEILFPLERTRDIKLEIKQVKPSTFHQVIKTSGQILSAQGDEVTISATTSGIVSFSKASLNEGASVKNGELLVNISSKKILDGDPGQRVKTAYEIAFREYERAESLIKDRLISEKEYNEIKLNYENAKRNYNSIKEEITAKGIGVTTPISGFVKAKMVNEGQYVEIGQPLLTITQNRKLQLRADVSERYYKDLGSMSLANFKTPYDKTLYKLSDLNGRLTSYGKSANAQEYYIPVNFEFDNIGQIISGSYVEVYLLGKIRENAITIPLSSLIEEQGLFFVFIQTHEDSFRKQEVTLGIDDGESVEVVSGIKEGDNVVTSGAYHIKLASASSAIPHGHEH